MARYKRTLQLTLIAAGMACCWPLLRRTYPGIMFSNASDAQLGYFVFVAFELVAIAAFAAILARRPLRGRLCRALFFIAGAGFAMSSLAFFPSFLPSYQSVLLPFGLTGFAVSVPVLFALWFDTLAMQAEKDALLGLSISFVISFAVSLLTLFEEPWAGLWLAAAPVFSVFACALVRKANDGGRVCARRSAGDPDALSFFGEIQGLLVLFIVIGGILRGLLNPSGISFQPSDDFESIVFRNLVSATIAAALAFSVYFAKPSNRSSVASIIAVCFLFIIGLFLLFADPNRISAFGMDVISIARNCLEFLLLSLLLSTVRMRKCPPPAQVLKYYLLPLYATQFISFWAVPALMSAMGETAEDRVYGVIALCVFLLMIGMLVSLGVLLAARGKAKSTAASAANQGSEAREQAILLSSEMSRRYGLTEREAETASLLAQGYSYKRISERLFISVSTVQSHTRSAYRKCGVNSREELMDLAESINRE